MPVRPTSLLVLAALVVACGSGGTSSSSTGTSGEPGATPVATPAPPEPPEPTATPGPTPEPQSVAWYLRASLRETGSGGFGGLLRSIDAGETWDLVFPYWGSASIDTAREGWLASDGALFRTVDGGHSWSSEIDSVPARAPRRFGPVAFFNRDEGILFASVRGTDLERPISIFQTTNGGRGWFLRERIEGCHPAVQICVTGRRAVALGCERRLLLQSNDAGATWTRSEPPFEVRFSTGNPLSCNGGSRFWLTDQGQAARSDDGGHTWVDQPLPTVDDVLVTAASFATAETGWSVGVGLSAATGTFVYRTDDGGASWFEQVHFERDARTSQQEVHFADVDHGIVLSQRLLPLTQPPFGPLPRRPVVYTTADGGASWSRLEHEDLPGEPFFLGIGGIGLPAEAPPRPSPAPQVDGPRAMLSARRAGLFRSDDLGVTWRSVLTLPLGQELYGVTMLDRDVAFAVGDSGAILTTIDGGATWSSRHEADAGAEFRSTRLVAPRFFDRERGVIGGQGNPSVVDVAEAPVLLFTEDGGDSWHPALISGLPEDPYGLFFGYYPRSVCVRPNGTALAGHQYSVRYASGGGVQGLIHRLVLVSHDYGASWRNIGDEIDAPDNFVIRDVACTSDSDLWLLGGLQDEATLPSIPFALHSSDAGETWAEVAVPIPGVLALGRSISGSAFVSPDDGWVVAGPIGDHLAVLSTSDGGATWRDLLVSEEDVFSNTRVARLDRDRAIVATSEQVGVLRQQPRVLLTEDAGATWTSVEFDDVGVSRDFLDLAAVP